MTISVITVLTLLTLHFIADFIFQSDWMAINKSKKTEVLLAHAGVYSLFFAGFGFKFWIITFLSHMLTDAITSRITSYLYPRSRHYFFVAIGADQLIHYTTLILTLCYLK